MIQSHITPSTFYLFYMQQCTTVARLDLLIRHLKRLEDTFLKEIQLADFLNVQKLSYKIYLFGQVDEIRKYLKEAELKREQLETATAH